MPLVEWKKLSQEEKKAFLAGRYTENLRGLPLMLLIILNQKLRMMPLRLQQIILELDLAIKPTRGRKRNNRDVDIILV